MAQPFEYGHGPFCLGLPEWFLTLHQFHCTYRITSLRCYRCAYQLLLAFLATPLSAFIIFRFQPRTFVAAARDSAELMNLSYFYCLLKILLSVPEIWEY